MKYLLIALVFFSSCQSNQPRYSEDQKKFQKKLNHFEERMDNFDMASNKLTKSEYRNLLLDSLKTYLTDSADNILRNFNVTVDRVDLVDHQDIRAFIARFSDASYNRYWMEFDYPRDSIDLLQKNPAYKLLKDVKPDTKLILSFFYMGDIEFSSDILGGNVNMKVVPFPQDYNFDSSRIANQQAKIN